MAGYVSNDTRQNELRWGNEHAQPREAGTSYLSTTSVI